LEYGKLLRILHALRWFTDEAFRRRIGRQLNRGETSFARPTGKARRTSSVLSGWS
jgi:TnpA family transposase